MHPINTLYTKIHYFVCGSCQYLNENRKQNENISLLLGQSIPIQVKLKNRLCHEMSNANVYMKTTRKCCQKFVVVIICFTEAKITPTKMKTNESFSLCVTF